MKLYRLCTKQELGKILRSKCFEDVGEDCSKKVLPNTHNYKYGKKYLHFFPQKSYLFYLNMNKDNFVCVYDIPDNIANSHKGEGFYYDYYKFEKIHILQEYAIETDLLKIDYLENVYKILRYVDYDDVLYNKTLEGFVKKISLKKSLCMSNKSKEKTL